MSALNAFGVNEHRKGITVLLHDRPADVVLRFPAIIERDDRTARGNVLIAASPRQIILQTNHSDTGVLQLLHLRFEICGRDLRVRASHLIHKTVITEHDRLRGLIHNRLSDSRWWRRSNRTARARAG